MLPFELGIALGDELLVVDCAQPLAARAERIDDVDDGDLAFDLLQRGLDDRARTRCR